jgi:L,D-transpeptidase YcbB
MQVRAAGLMIGLAGLLYTFGLPERVSRGAEVGLSDPPKLASVKREVPRLLRIAEPAAQPAQVKAIHVASPGDEQAATQDGGTTGSLPANGKVAGPEGTASQEPQEGSNGTQGDASPSSASEGQTDRGDRTAPDLQQNAEIPAPVRGLKDYIKSAIEALSAKPVHGSQAAELGKERAGLAAFYAERDYAPLWIADGKANEAARAVLGMLAHAEDDGLDLRAFAVPVFEGDDEKLADVEVALSAKVVAYGRQASGSRIDPRQLAALIGDKPDVAEPAAILSKVVEAGATAGTTLQSFNPPQAGYAALREKLAELRRAATPTAHVEIPAGPDLKVGMHDARVSLLRSRFELDATPADSQDLVYDTKVAAAVAGFQKANGLPASGVLSARTVAALSGGRPSRLENEILANMERWRWMPRDMGSSRIEVNVPEFMVSVLRDGQVVARNKVVVGKSDTPTPIFSNTMQFLIVNPYWNVPQSIIRKEMLPRLGHDPNYLHRLGYEVTWKNGRMTVRQPPGERNALGRIKFMFPNDYAVYLHDTPSRALFGASERAFSHGCVRVDQPFSFAEAVLGNENGWNIERVKHLIGGKERYVYLPKPLPIHIEYFTAFVDDAGRLQLRDDVYGYSARVKTALGLAN